jgi:broad specificity phosphatase PhoE
MVTVLAVRHADIDLPAASEDPELNAAGRVRADDLAHAVATSGVSTIFTSELTRTKQTVAPTARELGLLPAPRRPPPLSPRRHRSGFSGPSCSWPVTATPSRRS